MAQHLLVSTTDFRRFYAQSRIALLLGCIILLGMTTTKAAEHAPNAACDLKVDIITAYNFIVDSNIEAPPGKNPETAYIGAKICNDGTTPLDKVYAYSGSLATNTPGVYPSTTCPSPDCENNVGTMALEHVAKPADATRYLGTLAPGECRALYWLVAYPSLDANGDAVWGYTRDPIDDLDLQYDIWAKAECQGSPVTAEETRMATMRNEITAFANKIWPNGDNKVPNEYKEAMAAAGIHHGWRSNNISTEAGEVTRLEGIWYDMGVVVHGFDNNYDNLLDYNCWMQPVGDPSLFDPNCFILAHTSGLLIVKTLEGDLLIPFEDQLHFEHIPKNHGVVGLVFYDFIAANGPCSASMTPYQEAASGHQNEKFNADYGRTIPFESSEPEVVISIDTDQPSIDPNIAPPPLNHTITYSNPADNDSPIGHPDSGFPFVIQTEIPAGTTYIPNSATTGTYTTFYSSNGEDWYPTEDEAGTVNFIQWWTDEPLEPGDGGQVQFGSEVDDLSTVGGILTISTGASVGNNSPFVEDVNQIVILGENSIGDLVWLDNGDGGGTNSDGIPNGDELGLDDVQVSLYYDLNDNGELDDRDTLWATQTTSNNGTYGFTDLPDGTYIVVVNEEDVANAGCLGCGSTTPTTYIVDLDAEGVDPDPVAFDEADFGFVPSLTLTKSLISNNPAYENTEVVFEIKVKNELAYSGTRVVDLYSEKRHQGNSGWTNPGHVTGPPNGNHATMHSNTNSFVIGIEDPIAVDSCGTIESVKFVCNFSLDQDIGDDYILLGFQGQQSLEDTLYSSEIQDYIGGAKEYEWDISAMAGVLDWETWLGSQGGGSTIAKMTIEPVNGGSNTALSVDAIHIRLYTTCRADEANPVYEAETTLNPVPVTDSFDPSQLLFVSSNPSPSSINNETGEVHWDNIGPITGQGSASILATFKVLEANTPASAINMGFVTNAYTADGSPANNDSDLAAVDIIESGEIFGTIWNNTANGSDPAVFEQGESATVGALVNLYVCMSDGSSPIDFPANSIYPGNTSHACTANGNAGEWIAIDSIYTDDDGTYEFTGLPDGYYYTQVFMPPPLNANPQYDADGGPLGVWNYNPDNEADLGDILSINNAGTNQYTNVDFSYTSDPLIAGVFYWDINNNGIQDIGEPGIAGATVEITGANCAPCTVITDEVGAYYYTSPALVGMYDITVGSILPLGIDALTATSTFPLTIDQTLVAGVLSTTNSIGFTIDGAAVISDIVYFDLHADGIQNTVDEGVSGVEVTLSYDANADGILTQGVDPHVGTVTTLDGAVTFDDLPLGDYVMTVDEYTMPVSTVQTGDQDETGICTTCDGQTDASINAISIFNGTGFGYLPLGEGSIGVEAFYDANGDGNLSGLGETEYDSLLVFLQADLNGDGVFVQMDSAWTEVDRPYTFTDLPDGDYIVTLTDPLNLIPDAYSTTTSSSFSATIAGGITNNTTVCAQYDGICDYVCNDCPDSFDFGFLPLGTISSRLYWDANLSGQMDWDETGIENITVELCPLTNIDLGAGAGQCISTTTSDGTDGNLIGYYTFTDVPPLGEGEFYSLNVPNPPSLQTQDPDHDGLACDDPQLALLAYTPCDNMGMIYSLGFNANYKAGYFGYQPITTLSNQVWVDVNGDGLKNEEEKGLAGAEVRLCPPSTVNLGAGVGTCLITETDIDGNYSFHFEHTLEDGNYDLTVTPPTGYINVVDPDNTNDNTTELVLSNGLVLAGANAWCLTGPCNTDLDFGYGKGYETIKGNICIDEGDGTCGGTAGEENLANVLVNLYECLDANCEETSYVGTTTTDESGTYLFSYLANAEYLVSVGEKQVKLYTSSSTTTGTELSTGTFNDGKAVNTWQVAANTEDVDFGYALTLLDYGDLPDTYHVGFDENGPRHYLDPSLMLGTLCDLETTGIPSATASSDASDDGVSFTTANHPGGSKDWTAGTIASGKGGSLDLTVTGTGWVTGWIDFGGDGSLAGDMIFNLEVINGVIQDLVNNPTGRINTRTILFDIPENGSICDTTYARFRVFSQQQPIPELSYTGLPVGKDSTQQIGEVEDYEVPLASCKLLDSELINFQAVNDCPINISWSIYVDQVSHYILEHSSNSRDFVQLTKITENPNALGVREYFYTHSRNLHNTNYYRLKIVELNGKVSYSKVITIGGLVVAGGDVDEEVSACIWVGEDLVDGVGFIL